METLKTLQDAFGKAIWDAVPKLTRLGKVDLAKMYAKVVVSLSADRPELHALSLQRLGLVYENDGDFESAVLVYRRAISTEPKDVEVWYFLQNNFGYCLVQLERFAEAEWYCRQANVIDPNRHNAHKNLRLLLSGQGMFRDGAKELAAAASLCPRDSRALEHLEALLDEHHILKLEMPKLLEPIESLRNVKTMGGDVSTRRQEGSSSSAVPVDGAHLRSARRDGIVVALLEDEEELCSMLSRSLTGVGCKTVIFGNKQEFLKALPRLKVDVVVSDIYSPGLDGIRLLEEMKSRPRYRKIPVVIFSGHAEEESVALQERGAFAVIQKPADPEVVLEEVWKALKK